MKKMLSLSVLLISQSLTAGPYQDKLEWAIKKSSLSTFKETTNNPTLISKDLIKHLKDINTTKLNELNQDTRAHDGGTLCAGVGQLIMSGGCFQFLSQEENPSIKFAAAAAMLGCGYFGLQNLYRGWFHKKFVAKDIEENEKIGQLLKSKRINPAKQLPIFFHPNYDIGFFGIEKVHPFDSKKYGKVFHHIINNILGLGKANFIQPQHEVSTENLLKVHTPDYLSSLKSSFNVACITEVLPLIILPNFLVQKKLLSPMRLATQGTVDAAQLALKNNIATINLSGGYHHAKSNSGGGFCVYADIPLAMKILRKDNPDLKIMYIDLDAHQGNGVESFFTDDKKDPNTFIVDCYDEYNYPRDFDAMDAINTTILHEAINCDKHKAKFRNHGHLCQACNDAYLKAVKTALEKAKEIFQPDFVFYNAGTDCFEEDQIGAMALNKKGIIDRDQMVFEFAKSLNDGNGVPLCMTLSGGYSPKSADIIGSSIVNLYAKKLLKPISTESKKGSESEYKHRPWAEQKSNEQ